MLISIKKTLSEHSKYLQLLLFELQQNNSITFVKN